MLAVFLGNMLNSRNFYEIQQFVLSDHLASVFKNIDYAEAERTGSEYDERLNTNLDLGTRYP